MLLALSIKKRKTSRFSESDSCTANISLGFYEKLPFHHLIYSRPRTFTYNITSKIITTLMNNINSQRSQQIAIWIDSNSGRQ